MYREPDMKEIDDFMDSLGFDDKQLDELGKIFADNYMITGEVTEELEEALHRAPDALLDFILKTIQKPSQEIDRKEKEMLLLTEIPRFLEEQIVFMDLPKLKLLVKVASCHSLKPMEMATVADEFVSKGWAFNFFDGKSCEFVVMKQVRQILTKLEQEDVKKKIENAFMTRSLLNICLRLYGIFTKELFLDIFKEIGREEQELRQKSFDIERSLDEMLKTLETEGMLSVSENRIISSEVDSEELYNKIITIQKQKKNYIPTEQDIEAYVFGRWADKTREYKAVYGCLSHEIKDLEQTEEMLEEITKEVAVNDWGIPEIMNCLYFWDVAFTSQQSGVRLTKALSDWLYTIRRWSEYGYSRKERQLPNDQEQFITSSVMNDKKLPTEKKIYPNAPCPCGSGKKYKKCCGKQK